jgi:hypothetical protein
LRWAARAGCRLIREKAGYGLARPARLRTLRAIQKLPELKR